jgi:hypothetical protein
MVIKQKLIKIKHVAHIGEREKCTQNWRQKKLRHRNLLKNAGVDESKMLNMILEG